MGEWFHDTAASGSLALALPVALVAGLVSFFSPCVIPLLPGYLSYATGLSGADLASGAAGERRGRMLLGSVLFVLGFSVVFVAIGSLSGALGAWLVTWRDTLTLVLGVLTILLGLVFAGVFNRLLPWLQRDVRVHSVPAVGIAAAPLLGFLFGLAGRRAWGRRWRRSRRCRSTRPPPAAARCSPRRTPWGWAYRSSSPGWPIVGPWAPSGSSAATRPG